MWHDTKIESYGRPAERRHYLPVLQDGEVRTASINQDLYDLIIEARKSLDVQSETQGLLENQQMAARRFKISKLFYRTKR